MTYKPYRTPQPSKAQGPQLSPEAPTTYHFTTEQITARGNASLMSLATETGRLIMKLELPDTLHFVLPSDDRQEIGPKEMAIPEDKAFYIKMQKEATAIGDEYHVDASVGSNNGLADSVQYTVWRPYREGFVVPWGIHLTAAERTVYPRLRQQPVSEKSSLVMPTTPVNAIRAVIHDLVFDKYVGAEQIEPPIELNIESVPPDDIR